MFQRLTVGQDMLANTSELFSYELSSFPSSMFEANGLPKQAAIATLGEAIWTMGDCQSSEVPHNNAIHILMEGPSYTGYHGLEARHSPIYVANMWIT